MAIKTNAYIWRTGFLYPFKRAEWGVLIGDLLGEAHCRTLQAHHVNIVPPPGREAFTIEQDQELLAMLQHTQSEDAARRMATILDEAVGCGEIMIDGIKYDLVHAEDDRLLLSNPQDCRSRADFPWVVR